MYNLKHTIEIPDYLDRDALMQYCVFYVNKLLKGDGCSIFLKDTQSNKYILRESTVLSEYVGLEAIDMEGKKRQFADKGKGNIGLTFSTLYEGRCLNIPVVKEDERWTGYQRGKDKIANFQCELPAERMGSFIAAPLWVDKELIGLIRVVSEKENYFNSEKEEALIEFASVVAERIYNAISFSELIATGAILSLEALCQKVVKDTRKITRAKGCTIFLMDVEESSENIRIYRAIASTGLSDGKETYNEDKKNLNKVYYEVNMNPSFIPTSLTEYTIKNSIQIVINDIYSEEELKRFKNLDRKPGPGRYSEYILPKDPEHPMAGAIIFSPIFNRDKDQVIGLIRVNKPRVTKKKNGKEVNINIFTPYERRLLSSYIEKLTQILINITFFNSLDRISFFTNKDNLYSFAVKAAAKIVGGRGCSILILNPYSNLLEFKASDGYLSDKIEQLHPYEIGQGWTGWVAKYKRPLMFNDRNELDTEKYGVEKPKHSGRFEECETGGRTSDKFLSVPILRRDGDLLGVIRVPKVATDSNFNELDLTMLQSLANHVSLAIENIETFEKETATQKVINIYDLGALLQEQDDERRFFHIFLTGLTHKDAISFNRAILFEFDPLSEQLKGKMSIGPTDSKEGEKIRELMEEGRAFFTLERCIEEFDRRGGPVDDALYKRVTGSIIDVGKDCRLIQKIEKQQKIVREIEHQEYEKIFSRPFQEFLNSIDSDRIWLIILPIMKGRTFVIICDNIYDHKSLDSVTEHLLDTFLNLAIRALRGLYHKEELRVARESAWQDISALAAHRLGQSLPIIENRIWEVKEKQAREEDRAFWEETWKLVLSAKEVVSNLRLLAGEIRVSPSRPLPITNILSEIHDYLKETYKQISFRLHSPSLKEMPQAAVDMNKLKEAIAALIKNAEEAKTQGLVVTLGVDQAEKEDVQKLKLPFRQDYGILLVGDNGPGIRPELKEKIFEPFYTTKTSGTGLGLSIAKRIIEAHKGSIIEDGKFGQGALFKIFLPVKKEKP